MYVPLTLNLFFGKQITDLITLNVQSFNSVIVTEKKKKRKKPEPITSRDKKWPNLVIIAQLSFFWYVNCLNLW